MNMKITHRVLEAIREEFEKGIEKDFDPDYTGEAMAIYDRATALALGKLFLVDELPGELPGEVKRDEVVPY